MPQVMPSASGGLSPFALADKYNARNAAKAQTLTEQIGKTGRAYSDAITADTEALAGLQEAMVNNASDLLPILGPTGVGLVTGELARRNLSGAGPTGLDTSYMSRWMQQELQQRRADELATRGEAAASRFQAGQRIDPQQEAMEMGTDITSLPLAGSFNTRYSQGGGGVAFTMKDGTQIEVDPDRAVVFEAAGLGKVTGPAAAQGMGPATTASAEPTAPSPQPVPPPAPAPTGSASELQSQDITINGQRPSDDYSDLNPPAAGDVLADPIAARATELFPDSNLRRQPDGTYLATDPTTGADVRITAEELQEAIRLQENSARGDSGS